LRLESARIKNFLNISEPQSACTKNRVHAASQSALFGAERCLQLRFYHRRQNVGHLTAETVGDKTSVDYDVKNNGRGPTIAESITLDAAGLPTEWTVTGSTTFGSKVSQDQQMGSIEKGKLADFFLIPGDPIKNLKAIKTISMVVKDGTIYYPSEVYPKFGIQPFAAAPKVVEVPKLQIVYAKSVTAIRAAAAECSAAALELVCGSP
jgi:hypothetical protein